MLDSRVLETAIGLIFMFLGLSLTATAIQEFVASALKLRARTLKYGLKEMLTEGKSGLEFYEKLIGHPIVAPAGESPSYISASQFSITAIHLITGQGSLPTALPALKIALQNLPDAPYKTAMLAMFRDGETDFAIFESRLQQWFDQSMDRVSGIYKRISQYISLGIGAVLAYAFQANAIAIGTSLWDEPSLRTGVVTNATTIARSAGAPTLDKTANTLALFHFSPIWEAQPTVSWGWFIGCAVTAVAVSLGAPFWFDLLQTFVSLRGTGPVPAKADKRSY